MPRFTGTFREAQPPSKIVHTEAYDAGTVGGEYWPTMRSTLIDSGSKEARDAAVPTGMTGGMEQSYQRLDRGLEQQARE